PDQTAVTVRVGDVVTVGYTIINESAHETVGQASYNVWPPTAGAYFSKINCFCFTEQRLKPGERRDMPVVFFVDPELAKDAEHDYHLVDPSPWPIIGAVSVFLLALGLITWMHHSFRGAPVLFAIGAIGTLYTMFGWWRDVAREATYQGYHTRVVQISHRYGMI